MKKSYLEQILVHKSLDFQLGTSDLFMDHMLSDLSGNENLKNQFKNVCAHIPLPLVDRLENTLGILNLSKRQFLTAAIIEALDKADQIMEEWGVGDYIEENLAPEKKEAA